MMIEVREHLHKVELSLLEASGRTIRSKRGRKPPQLCHVVDDGHFTFILSKQEMSSPFSRAMAGEPWCQRGS